MLLRLTRSFIVSIGLVVAFTGSSALGAGSARAARERAASSCASRSGHRRQQAGVRCAKPRSERAPSTKALLGDGTVESRLDTLAAGRAAAFRLQAGATGGPVGIAHVYVGAGNEAGTVFAGVYEEGGTFPSTLLGSGSAAVSESDAWISVPLQTVDLAAHRTYWLAILGSGGALRFRSARQRTCRSQTSARGDLAALPPEWSPGSRLGLCRVSAYLTKPPPATEEPAPELQSTLPSGVLGEPAPVPAPTAEPPTALPNAPAALVAPAIAGVPIEGVASIATPGVWTEDPSAFAYQWQRCEAGGEACAEIEGGTSSTYTPSVADLGHTLRVVVTADNAGGSASAASPPTPEVIAAPGSPADTAPPSVGGVAEEGRTLTASTGTWTEDPFAYAYQWQDCNASGGACADVGGATSSSYTVAAADVGHTIRVVVTATNAFGSTAAASATTPAATPQPPSVTGPPKVTGSTEQGQTLTTSRGAWTGSPTTYAYRWQDCNTSGQACANVAGATSASYKLTSADVGHTVVAVVTATNAGGSGEAGSAPTATVTSPAPVNTGLPTITGATEEGQTLSASSGTWTGSPSSYGYQWEDCNGSGGACSAITGATSPAYRLLAADVGHTIRVVVTATNGGGSAGASSAATAVVTAQQPAGAEVFVAQSGAGSQNGEGSCANAHPLSWLNSSGSWGTGAGRVAPGTTVALCGTLTSPVEVQGNGVAGNPVTILFTTGAKIAMGGAGCPGTGCIDLGNRREYVTVDGGSDGVIENTDRGARKERNESPTTGIGGTSLKHVTVEDVEIANLYVAEEGESSPIGNTEIRGIFFHEGEPEYLTIRNDVVHDTGWAINVTVNGNSNHVYIEHNTLYHDSHGISPTGSSEGGNVGPVVVAYNHFYGDGVWASNPGLNHMDGIHCYTGDKGDGTRGLHWSGLYIYDNQITMEGEYGVTAPIYLEGSSGPQCGDSTSKFWIFNNVLSGRGAGAKFALNNGLLSPYSGEEHIFDNTFIGNKTSEGSCIPVKNPSSEATNIAFENNVLTTCHTLIDAETGKMAAGSPDYDLYANAGTANEAFACPGHELYFSQFAEWRTCIDGDSHSIAVAGAKLSADETFGQLGKPEAGSEAIQHGANLTSLCASTPEEALCKNIDGEPRPATGAWNIGAY